MSALQRHLQALAANKIKPVVEEKPVGMRLVQTVARQPTELKPGEPVAKSRGKKRPPSKQRIIHHSKKHLIIHHPAENDDVEHYKIYNKNGHDAKYAAKINVTSKDGKKALKMAKQAGASGDLKEACGICCDHAGCAGDQAVTAANGRVTRPPTISRYAGVKSKPSSLKAGEPVASLKGMPDIGKSGHSKMKAWHESKSDECLNQAKKLMANKKEGETQQPAIKMRLQHEYHSKMAKMHSNKLQGTSVK